MFQNIFKGRWLGILLLLLVATMPTSVQAATKVETSATIDSLTTSCSGISITGTGSYQQGISKVAFVLTDTDQVRNGGVTVVDRKEFSYNSKPLPKQVTESWSSTLALTPGTHYRVVFQVWGKQAPYTFPQLVAYDGVDFTCT